MLADFDGGVARASDGHKQMLLLKCVGWHDSLGARQASGNAGEMSTALKNPCKIDGCRSKQMSCDAMV